MAAVLETVKVIVAIGIGIGILTSDNNEEQQAQQPENAEEEAGQNDPDPERPTPPPPATQTQRIMRNNLDDRTLDAARREARGEVVGRRPDGRPYDHVTKVREGQRGLVNRIGDINQRLSNPNTPPSERAALQRELADASRGLDRSEQFLPRP